MIALLSVAAIMVLGVVAAVVFLVANRDDSPGSSLGTVRDIDTSRPEAPIITRPVEVTPAPVAPAPSIPRSQPSRPGPASAPVRDLEPPTGNAVRVDEIEDVARRYQDMTQRCYMRAQRGAEGILTGDVKKIAITLTIDRDGGVSDVALSEHAATGLGRCLASSIKSWKFRPSPGGQFRFSLVF